SGGSAVRQPSCTTAVFVRGVALALTLARAGAQWVASPPDDPDVKRLRPPTPAKGAAQPPAAPAAQENAAKPAAGNAADLAHLPKADDGLAKGASPLVRPQPFRRIGATDPPPGTQEASRPPLPLPPVLPDTPPAPPQKPTGAAADGRKEGMTGGPPPALPL